MGVSGTGYVIIRALFQKPIHYAVPRIRYVNNDQPPITVSASYCAVSYVFDVAPGGSGGDGQGCSATISGTKQWTLGVTNQANCGFSCF